MIGRYVVKGGKTVSDVRDVEFKGELLARHQWGTGPCSGVRQRLFRTPDGRYIVSVATWRTKPRQETHYTLHEVTEDDLMAGGEYEALGAALREETALSLDEALDLERALDEALKIIGGEK